MANQHYENLNLPDHPEEEAPHKKSHGLALLVGCIGIVYGDIGTSPLYAMREAATRVSDGGIQPHELFGVLSLILWALIIVVTLKYVVILMRADNRGEGGILSLMSLAQKVMGRKGKLIFFAGIIGAALFYGDAAITPAISVLSAVEGFKLVTPAFDNYVLPMALIILCGIFYVQRKGTGKVAAFFGPIMVTWFGVMGFIGLLWVIKNPSVLACFNPYYALKFMAEHGILQTLHVLGSVFLAVTGAEALYADLGHFGRRPIQRAWLWFVFPCLALNYLGQCALLLARPESIENPFFLLVPEWALLPLVCLATLATIIACQAVITGAFSLTRQAIQLGLLPRMEIRHTSAMQEGQIYIPQMNTLLLYAVLFITILFGSSSALASAYGIAVSGTMIVTTLMTFIVVARVWKKGLLLAFLITSPFLVIEVVFTVSNMLKVFDGGFVPLIMSAFVVLLITTWVAGSRYLFRRAHRQSLPMTELLERLDRNPPHIAEGTAIFLTSDPHTVPEALVQNLRHNQVIHENNIILTVIVAPIPKIPETGRLIVEQLSSRLLRVVVSYGYMETPDVTRALFQARKYGVDVDVEHATFFLSRRKIVSDPRRGLPGWQDKIYIAMSRSAVAATDFYKIPHSHVVEMGIQLAV